MDFLNNTEFNLKNQISITFLCFKKYEKIFFFYDLSFQKFKFKPDLNVIFTEKINIWRATIPLKNYYLTKSRPILRRSVFIAAIITLVLIFTIPIASEASITPSVEWTKTFTGFQGSSVIQTVDGGYALAGETWVPGSATFVKIDSSGNIEWRRSYGDVLSVVQTEDSGYALFCNDRIVKIDGEGNYESSFSLEMSGAKEGILTRDGDYVLVGNRRSDNGENLAWLLKIDKQGNVLWNKTFTGGFNAYSVTETADRGCVLTGNWKNDFWLAKIDYNSNQQWSQTYPSGDISDTHYSYSVAKTKDGGYVLAGTGDWQASGSYVPWLIKVNSQGHAQWNLPYGHLPHDTFSDVVQTNDEGYVVIQGESPVLVRTDSSGSEIWEILLDSNDWMSNFTSSCLIRTSDGGYVVAGSVLENIAFITKISAEPDFQPPVVTISSPKSESYQTHEIPLIFTVSEYSYLSYSLDGNDEVVITGNTTLSNLSFDSHNITVYARDAAGLVGKSFTIQFTVVAPFPTEMVLGGVTVAVIICICILIYFKRQSLSAYRKRGLTSLFTKQRFVAFANNKMVVSLTVISLSIFLVFVQIFFPFFYFSSSSGSSSAQFEVGISYVYEQDNIEQIYDEVAHIKDLGFSVIRVNLVCDPLDPSHYSNTLTNVFFDAVKQLSIKVALIINNHDSCDSINYYLDKWGNELAYVQVLNEPDVASSWDIGALFTDDEAGSRFEEVYNIVEQYQLSAQRYTNFGPAFMIRTNLPIQFSEKLDFVGFDVFMESFLSLSPRMIQLLQKITSKEIVIAEFGMSTSDDVTQSDYIIRGLNLFKSMGVKGCWIVYWNSEGSSYGIRGRLTEQKVGEWIEENT